MEVTDEPEEVESSSDEDTEESSTEEVPSKESSKNPPAFSEQANKLRNHISATRGITDISTLKIPSNVGTPPKDVLLDSQQKNNTESTTDFDPSTPNNKEPTAGKGAAVGGTLYTSLVKLTRRKKKVQRRSKKVKLR